MTSINSPSSCPSSHIGGPPIEPKWVQPIGLNCKISQILIGSLLNTAEITLSSSLIPVLVSRSWGTLGGIGVGLGGFGVAVGAAAWVKARFSRVALAFSSYIALRWSTLTNVYEDFLELGIFILLEYLIIVDFIPIFFGKIITGFISVILDTITDTFGIKSIFDSFFSLFFVRHVKQVSSFVGHYMIRKLLKNLFYMSLPSFVGILANLSRVPVYLTIDFLDRFRGMKVGPSENINSQFRQIQSNGVEVLSYVKDDTEIDKIYESYHIYSQILYNSRGFCDIIMELLFFILPALPGTLTEFRLCSLWFPTLGKDPRDQPCEIS